MDSFCSDISKIISNGDSFTNQSYSDLKLLHESRKGAFVLFRSSRFGRWVVLKTLKEEFRGDPFYESILLKEFQIGNELRNPWVIETIDFISHNSLGNAIVLQYIDGVTLREYLNENAPLSPQRAKEFINGICEATGYLHSHKIIHRDLKPENIMVERQTDAVKIIDLGCADASDYSIIKGPAGTRHYAAPEQLTPGNEIDARADIFAIGKIMLDIIDATEPPLRRFSHIALRCAAADPADRYSSIDEIIAAVNKKSIASMWGYFTTIIALLVGGTAYWLTSRHESRLYPPLVALVADSLAADSAIDTVLPKQTPASVDTIMSKSESQSAVNRNEVTQAITPQPLFANEQQQSTTHQPQSSIIQNSDRLTYHIRLEKADSIYDYYANYIRETASSKLSGVVNQMVIHGRSYRPKLDDYYDGNKYEVISGQEVVILYTFTHKLRDEFTLYVSDASAERYIRDLNEVFYEQFLRYINTESFKRKYDQVIDAPW